MSSVKERIRARLHTHGPGSAATASGGQGATAARALQQDSSEEDDDADAFENLQFGEVSDVGKRGGSSSSTPTSIRRRSVPATSGERSSPGTRRNVDGQRGSPSLSAMNSQSSAWGEAEKQIYEEQLELLQEQLESVMIEKERLAEEVRSLQSMEVGMWAQQLEEERQRSLELSVQVQSLQQRSRGVGASSSDGSDVDATWVSVSRNGPPIPHLMPSSGLRQRHRPGAPDVDHGEMVRTDSLESDTGESSAFRRAQQYVLSKVVSVLADFTVDADFEENGEDPDELTFNKLKSNWKRFWDDAKPIYAFFKYIDNILHWEQWTTSLACFLLYMYSVWLGLLVPSGLFIAIAYLSFTYLKNTGILSRFSTHGASSAGAEAEDSSGQGGSRSRYLQLVMQVAQKVQNTSGSIGDNLEKCQNLLAWRHVQATQKLYNALWVFFLLSCFLSEATVFRIAGLFLGYKLFVERSVYRRFPKVKAKYDTVARIWEELPTNAELETFVAKQQQRAETPGSDDIDGNDASVLASDQQFCDRFGFTLEQRPLDGWKPGCHCRLIDRDRPLASLAAAGKLFMTAGYLCYGRDRARRDSSSEGDIKIPLTDIAEIKKAKAFARLPGSGMSIEVQLVNVSKPYLFGAILNRTEVLQTILAAGRRAGLPWACRSPARASSSAAEQT